MRTSPLLQWGRDLEIAEMGPRVPGLPKRGLLQWGRDLEIAEMEDGVPPDMEEQLLQWGRDLEIAEMWSEYGSLARQMAKASMGPRSGDRGNAGPRQAYRRDAGASMGPRSGDRGNGEAKAGKPAKGVGLQWGRDLEIAEIGNHSAASRAGYAGFNGAAIWRSRKWP